MSPTTFPRRRSFRSSPAFSLLELMVVIALVTAATGVVLPLVSRTRGQSRDVRCQANLRQILQGITCYALDNNGQMPYGFYYVHGDPVTWAPLDYHDEAYVSWVKVIAPYITSGDETVPSVFRCPQAAEQAPPHKVSYVMNFIVAISPYYELYVGSPPNAQLRPPNMSLMLPQGTALVWDTPVIPDDDPDRDQGILVGADIDDQRFWIGASIPQFRYFSPSDPFASFPPGTYGNSRPILLSHLSLYPGYTYHNIDPKPESYYPYQGNLRFRHSGQTVCNTGYSDGSVRQFTATIGPNNTVTQHNAIRRDFMINYPPGVIPDPSYPSFGR